MKTFASEDSGLHSCTKSDSLVGIDESEMQDSARVQLEEDAVGIDGD